MTHPEETIQRACVMWFAYQYPDIAPLLHHSPNGGYRTKREAAIFKSMGTRAGFPDLILLVPRGGCPYLCIELKTDKGRQSPQQKNYQQIVESVGAKYAVVRSLEEFIDITTNYLKQ